MTRRLKPVPLYKETNDCIAQFLTDYLSKGHITDASKEVCAVYDRAEAAQQEADALAAKAREELKARRKRKEAKE